MNQLNEQRIREIDNKRYGTQTLLDKEGFQKLKEGTRERYRLERHRGRSLTREVPICYDQEIRKNEKHRDTSRKRSQSRGPRRRDMATSHDPPIDLSYKQSYSCLLNSHTSISHTISNTRKPNELNRDKTQSGTIDKSHRPPRPPAYRPPLPQPKTQPSKPRGSSSASSQFGMQEPGNHRTLREERGRRSNSRGRSRSRQPSRERPRGTQRPENMNEPNRRTSSVPVRTFPGANTIIISEQKNRARTEQQQSESSHGYGRRESFFNDRNHQSHQQAYHWIPKQLMIPKEQSISIESTERIETKNEDETQITQKRRTMISVESIQKIQEIVNERETDQFEHRNTKTTSLENNSNKQNGVVVVKLSTENLDDFSSYSTGEISTGSPEQHTKVNTSSETLLSDAKESFLPTMNRIEKNNNSMPAVIERRGLISSLGRYFFDGN